MKKALLFFLLIGHCGVSMAWRLEYGGNININRPVYEDLYIAGGTITINAPVYGDLVIAGGTILINDSVTGDILLAGGTVTFNGYAGDDIRCAGGRLQISKNVAGDVVISGGNIRIDPGVTIGGLLAVGGEATLDGTVNGSVKGGFGTFTLNGTVTKDIDCRGGKIKINGGIGGKAVLAAEQIHLGERAAFGGNVRYWSRNGVIDFGPSLKNGSLAEFDPALRIRTGKWYFLGTTTLLGLLWYLGMALLMILLVQYLFSTSMKKAADTVFNATLKSLGAGLLYFIGVPVAALVAFVTIIGIPVGLLLVTGYIIGVLLVTVIISVVMANWINNRYQKNWTNWHLGFAAFGLFILLKLVSFTPFAGWLIMIFLALLVSGGILVNIQWKRKKPVAVSA